MISEESVRKIAQLARLKLEDQEIAMYGQQLSSILEKFQRLAKVPTDNVAPLVTPTEIAPLVRFDEVQPSLGAEGALQNAPEKVGRLFKVPPVV